jgi:hypothetical protein
VIELGMRIDKLFLMSEVYICVYEDAENITWFPLPRLTNIGWSRRNHKLRWELTKHDATRTVSYKIWDCDTDELLFNESFELMYAPSGPVASIHSTLEYSDSWFDAKAVWEGHWVRLESDWAYRWDQAPWATEGPWGHDTSDGVNMMNYTAVRHLYDDCEGACTGSIYWPTGQDAQQGDVEPLFEAGEPVILEPGDSDADEKRPTPPTPDPRPADETPEAYIPPVTTGPVGPDGPPEPPREYPEYTFLSHGFNAIEFNAHWNEHQMWWDGYEGMAAQSTEESSTQDHSRSLGPDATAWQPAGAVGPGPGVWHTGLALRNKSFHNSTQVSIEFYNPNGTLAVSWVDFIQAKSSLFLYSGGIVGMPEEGTASVGSYEEVAVVANVVSDWPDKTESAYVGLEYAVETDTELFAPSILKNYYENSSSIRVMNLSNTWNTCVRVRYYRLGESEPLYTEYKTVTSNGGYTFIQEDEPNLGTTFIGTARIDSVDQMGTCTGGYGSRHLAALVHISIDPGPLPGNDNPWRLHAVHGPVKRGDYIAYAPVLCNDYHGNDSSLTILNMRDTGQWVRVTYSSGHTKTKYVAARSSELWWTPNEGPPTNWNGTGIAECLSGQYGYVTTECEIVATINQINNQDGNFASYNGFTSDNGQRISHLPVVTKNYFEYAGYVTTVTCMNVDDHWVAVFLQLDGLPRYYQWLAPNAAYSWYLANEAWVPDGYNGSGYAYAYYAPEKIICLGQQNAETPSTSGDWLTTYNGISDHYP